MIQAVSHLVIAARDVKKQVKFLQAAFTLTPHFENEEFAEFVLPGAFRLAFFFPTGKTTRYFSADSDRKSLSIGITVADIDLCFNAIVALQNEFNFEVSGPPKEHPWGEKSFLLIDPEGNRWEVTQSPSSSGMLVQR